MATSTIETTDWKRVFETRVAEALSEGLAPQDALVLEAFSQLLAVYRHADPRNDGGPRFTRDDGIIASSIEWIGRRTFMIRGYTWWIDQTVDPIRLVACVEDDPEWRLCWYTIQCGLPSHLLELSPAAIEAGWTTGIWCEREVQWMFDVCAQVDPS